MYTLLRPILEAVQVTSTSAGRLDNTAQCIHHRKHCMKFGPDKIPTL